MKPEAVAETERVLGAVATTWSPVKSRGYALGDRWLVQLEDGSSVFVKRAIGQPTATALRTERHIYATVRGPFMPQLLGWADGELPLLVLEDLSEAHWPPPWSPGSVDAVLETLAAVAVTPPPPGLPHLADEPPAGWDAVAHDPEPFLALGVCSRTWLEGVLPKLLAASASTVLAGKALVHFDVRSDNLCIRDGRAMLVDWNIASVGNPALDVAFWLPSLMLEQGPTPGEVAHVYPATNDLASFVAGFFAARAGLTPPPGAPAVRAFQLAQLEVALPWAARVLGLPAQG